MKRSVTITLAALVVTGVLLLQPGCNPGRNSFDSDGYMTGGILHVDYVKGYNNIGELAADADLIVIGTIDRTVEVVVDEATRDEPPMNRSYLTMSALKTEQVVKGNAGQELIISQEGAIGRLEEYGNPVFRPGERLFLFLREGQDSTYYLLHPLGRYAIKDNFVYSMNYVLPTGQSRPPLDLIFWRIDLEEFIGRVNKEIPN